MVIEAVVVDIGGVLERVADDTWPEVWIGRWERRMEKPRGTAAAALARHAPDDAVATGRVTEDELRRIYTDALGLDDAQAEQMWAELWDAYCGELDVTMRDFVAGLRPAYRTAILSNSADGARREEQRRYDFAGLVDVLLYSHEIGLAKPDPAVFQLADGRLGVRPEQVVFVDDHAGHVDAARAHGWHAVRHEQTERTIAEVSALLGPDRPPHGRHAP